MSRVRDPEPTSDPIGQARGLPDPLPPPLVVRARTDPDALGELYDRTHGVIYRYCRRHAVSRVAAEDACSAVFLTVAKKMAAFRGETEEAFRRWVFGIARRETAAAARKVARRAERLNHAAETNAVGSPRDPGGPREPDEGEQLATALGQLSHRDQTLLELRYTEGLAPVEIAETLGMRPGAVRTAISRALERLRSLMPTEDS